MRAHGGRRQRQAGGAVARDSGRFGDLSGITGLKMVRQ